MAYIMDDSNFDLSKHRTQLPLLNQGNRNVYVYRDNLGLNLVGAYLPGFCIVSTRRKNTVGQIDRDLNRACLGF